MEGERQAEVLAEAMRRVPDGPILHRVVAAAPQMLGVRDVTAALVTEQGGGGVVASSGRAGRELVDLEFALGEGPGRAAFATDVEIACPDLASDGAGHWPAYTEQALELDVRAVFAFPARIGAMSMGVLVAHRDVPGFLQDDHLRDARIVADVCCTLMVDHAARLGAEDLSDEGLLWTGWPNRAVVHQATGMLATQLGTSLPVALARLRAYAFGAGRQLDDVARDVVDRRLRITP